jgi:Cys-tRNA(Pro)/Cys-tRNA(Cys) deacylase
MNEKTNVMRVLQQKKIEYKSYSYEPDSSLTGGEIADILGEPKERVFKTLVTEGKAKTYYVFVIPVEKELDLKKAAKAVSEKSVAMLPLKELLPLTGYVHGGCSPIGMKKLFPTYMDWTAEFFETVFVSAGRVGCQIELAPADLIREAKCELAELTVD